jgi:hypothetical protein
MKEIIYLAVSEYRVERMTKNLPQLSRGEIPVKLPTDWRPVLRILENDRRIPRSKTTQEQALRVAWRIVKDWVEAQLAIIETQMVTTAQVFLPYATTATGQSLYEYIGQNTNLLLGGGEADHES